MSLSVRQVSKRFGDLLANDAVDLELSAGTVHAVLGENGAGKSTLMKVIAGTLSPDAGEIRLDGEPITLGSPGAALAAGVGMLAQEPLVCLPFTARENFRLGSRWSLDEAGRLLTHEGRRLGFDIDPTALTRTLSIGERQQLEIVRLLARGIKVLILDEPTSGLTGPQREQLFSSLHRLADEGLIVLFVSHKLPEVNELCGSVTVMRHGRVVGERTLPQPERELVNLMFEHGLTEAPRSPVATHLSSVAELTEVSAGYGRQAIVNVDLQVGSGEVIGVAGIEGSGQAALVRVLAGQTPVRRGRLRINGRDLTGKGPSEFLAEGVVFVPGGRLEEGLLPGLSISEHLELAHGQRLVVDWKHAGERAQAGIEAFRVRGKPDTAVDQLSGGNQQRVLLSLLPPKVSLLVMEQPTRGLDIDSAAYVWGRLLERRQQGTAIVFASADTDEIRTYADRILVVFDGRVIANRPSADLEASELGGLLGGVAAR